MRVWDHVHWDLFCSDYIISATRTGFYSTLSTDTVSDNQFHLCNRGDETNLACSSFTTLPAKTFTQRAQLAKSQIVRGINFILKHQLSARPQ